MMRLGLVAILAIGFAAPGLAQSSTPAAESVVGTWTGTVDLLDGSQSIPAEYRFTKTGEQLGGTATATGQGTGDMSAVSQTGDKVHWTVVLPQGVFVHDGTLKTTGTLEGVILLEDLPVASFKLQRQKP